MTKCNLADRLASTRQSRCSTLFTNQYGRVCEEMCANYTKIKKVIAAGSKLLLILFMPRLLRRCARPSGRTARPSGRTARPSEQQGLADGQQEMETLATSSRPDRPARPMDGRTGRGCRVPTDRKSIGIHGNWLYPASCIHNRGDHTRCR